jgi:hypothetical protein
VDGTVNHTVLTVIEKTESKFRNITGFTIKWGDQVSYLRFLELARWYSGHLFDLVYSLAHRTVYRGSEHFQQLVGHRNSALERKYTCKDYWSAMDLGLHLKERSATMNTESLQQINTNSNSGNICAGKTSIITKSKGKVVPYKPLMHRGRVEA